MNPLRKRLQQALTKVFYYPNEAVTILMSAVTIKPSVVYATVLTPFARLVYDALFEIYRDWLMVDVPHHGDSDDATIELLGEEDPATLRRQDHVHKVSTQGTTEFGFIEEEQIEYSHGSGISTSAVGSLDKYVEGPSPSASASATISAVSGDSLISGSDYNPYRL